MSNKVTPEQIALIRKNSGLKSKRYLAFSMGLSISTVSKYYAGEDPATTVFPRRAHKEDFVYPDALREHKKTSFKRPPAEYDQSPSPYGIANKLMGVKLTTRCYFNP